MLSVDDREVLNFEESCIFLKIIVKKHDYSEAISKMDGLFRSNELGFYLKNKIEIFLANHISLADAFSELNKFETLSHNHSNFKRTIKNLHMDVVKFSRYVEGQFITNKNFEIIHHYCMKINNHPDSILYTKYELKEELQLGVGTDTFKLDSVLDEYGIKPYITLPNGKGKNFYSKDALMFLKSEQKRKLRMIEVSYMALKNAASTHDLNDGSFNSYIHSEGLDSQLVPPPTICIMNNSPLHTNGKLVPKQIVNQYVEYVKEKNTIQDILINSEVQPYQTYQDLLQHYNIRFTNESSLTEYYWNSFVRIKLQKTTRSGNNLKDFISMMVSITKALVELTSLKELFSFTEKEISLALFKDHVPNQWQRQLYNFFNQFNNSAKSSGVKVIDLKLIPNPKHKFTVQKEKETYSVKEYLDLIDYCNMPFHKSLAIADAQSQIKGEKFKSYPSVWLYSIIHLNNAWRHSDVLLFPRLTIPQFNHITLQWLENNELSFEDAELIADFYRSKHYIHSKNQRNRYFIISDELLLAFANAVLISECIQREIYPLSDRIIGFQNKSDRLLSGPHDEFFGNFQSDSVDFEFKSTIINRTVMSLATDVISKLSDSNAIDAIKFFRNHSNIEITNIYLDVPQEHVNRIADQLFNIGNFGYVYDNLSLLLFGQEKDREIRGKNATMVKKTFGSIERIESIASCALAMATEREQVEEFLIGLTPEEKLEKYNLLNWGLSPSKSFDAQCLVGIDNCPMETRDCDKCPLMIPNRFTLCNLNLKINDKIETFIETYGNTNLEGEKVKVANQLYMSLDLVKQAISTFGRNTVSHYINLDSINDTMMNLPSFKQHVSLIKQERSAN